MKPDTPASFCSSSVDTPLLQRLCHRHAITKNYYCLIITIITGWKAQEKSNYHMDCCGSRAAWLSVGLRNPASRPSPALTPGAQAGLGEPRGWKLEPSSEAGSRVQRFGNRDAKSSRAPRENPEVQRSPGRRGADTLPAFVSHCVCVEASGGPRSVCSALRPA